MIRGEVFRRTLCSFCRMPINDEAIKERRVYRLDELDYIEVAHERCAPDEEGWK